MLLFLCYFGQDLFCKKYLRTNDIYARSQQNTQVITLSDKVFFQVLNIIKKVVNISKKISKHHSAQYWKPVFQSLEFKL